MKKQHQKILAHLRRGCHLKCSSPTAHSWVMIDPARPFHRQAVLFVKGEAIDEMKSLGLLVEGAEGNLLPARGCQNAAPTPPP